MSFTKNYFATLISHLSELNYSEIDTALLLIEKAWHDQKQIITLGNGGSALTALHFINDWNKSLSTDAHPFRGRSLVDNIGLVMAYANDFSYAEIFTQQLKTILNKDDLVIGISSSGQSENVINAIKYANQCHATTLSLVGFNGGELKKHTQHSIHIQVDDVQLVEDIHAIFGHLVMKKFCQNTQSQTKLCIA